LGTASCKGVGYCEGIPDRLWVAHDAWSMQTLDEIGSEGVGGGP